MKGTQLGAITDMEGRYTLRNVPDGATLSFSYIGFQSQDIRASDTRALARVELKEDAELLDEVVVLGYGNIRRSDVTGSIASVSAETLSKVASSSIADAIAGKMAGVQVTTADGALDAEISVRVRGGGSITQDNSPLYLVDGFPVDDLSGIPLTDIESIDVLKEASMTAIYGARGANGVVIITTKNPKIGKTSIQFNSYVQTRTLAKKLPVMDNYEFVMADYEYEMIRKGSDESFIKNFGYYDDIELYKYTDSTDWQDEILGGNPISQYYNVTINGGTEKTKFNLSYTFNDDEGQLIGSGMSRHNINLKLNQELVKNLRLETNATYRTRTIDGAGTAGTSVLTALRYRPTNGLSSDVIEDAESDEENLDEEGNTLNKRYTPLEENEQNYRKRTEQLVDLKAALVWDIVKGLQFRSEYGISTKYSNDNKFYGALSSKASGSGMNNLPSAERTKGYKETYRLANTLTYRNSFNKRHNVNLMVGQEINHSQSEQTFMSARYFPATITAEAALENFALGTPNQSTSSKEAPTRTASYFGRALYNFRNRYYATFTMRADGSTKFAPGNQWGVFPAGSIAWRLSNEPWMKNVRFISELKLRASYGLAGNNRINDDLWHSVYAVKSGSTAPEFNNEEYNYYQFADQTYLYDPDLKWETTITRNVGVDWGFWNNRLSGSLDFYWNTTRDLLMQAEIPSITGYNYQYQNMGQTSNKGVELTLNAVILDTKQATLNFTANVAYNRNRIDKLASENPWSQNYSWSGSNIEKYENFPVEEGGRVGEVWGYRTNGVFTAYDPVTNPTGERIMNGTGWVLKDGVRDNSASITGGALYPGGLKLVTDADGNPVKQRLGNTVAPWTGGFGLNGTLGNFDFNAFFNYSLGGDIINGTKLITSFFSGTSPNYNLNDDFALGKRYTWIDPANGMNLARPNSQVLDTYGGERGIINRLNELNAGASTWSPVAVTRMQLIDYAVEDASFLRLNNLTVGYTLPKAWVKKAFLQNVRLYFTGYNLFCWTGYSGADPEVDTSSRKNPLNPGIDYAAYPKSRSYVGGINISF